MTLRVEVSIVPFGNEENKRIIETLNISNVAHIGMGVCEYVIEHNSYKNADKDTPILYHDRKDGALELVYKSLGKLLGHE